MAYDKKDIALSVGGILASMVVAYLIYRMEANNAATAQQDAAAQAAEAESALANQQAQVAALPSISVPAIATATPSTTDTTNQAQASAIDPNLEAIIAAFQSQPSSSVTSQTSIAGSVIPTIYAPPALTIPDVTVPTLITNFNNSSTSSPAKSTTLYGTGQ
jgi:hypothetical protein